MSNFEIKKWELLGSYGKAIFPIVYCPNLVNFMYPLHESLKSVLPHFFPSKRMLNVYSSTSGLDMDGSVFSLLNLYCTSIANRMINSKLLAKEEIYRTTINAFLQSVEHQKVLRFTDNEISGVTTAPATPASQGGGTLGGGILPNLQFFKRKIF